MSVASFAELVARPFAEGVNALCWPRALTGDFGEVARALAPVDGFVDVDGDTLRALDVSSAGRAAAEAILADLRALDELGREPALSCITRYACDTRGLAIATDLYSFHADRAPIEVDTWLCTYAGAPSEGLENAHARRLIDDPEIRARLVREHAAHGADDLDAWVRDGSFDLHYAPMTNAPDALFSFGVGNLWRLAVDWPGARVPPCLHRAPQTDAPRLLLIA